MRIKGVHIVIFILFYIVLTPCYYSQSTKLRGVVKVRKPDEKEVPSFKKREFSSKENPLAGQWELKEYQVNKKYISLDKNTHILVFYDSTYHFRRIYEKPKSKIYEGTFPVDVLRRKINASKDTVVKFNELQVYDYHLLYDSDTLMLTELVNMSFDKFTYSENKISFIVKEYDENNFVIRTLYFVYERVKD